MISRLPCLPKRLPSASAADVGTSGFLAWTSRCDALNVSRPSGISRKPSNMWVKIDDGFATHPKVLAAGPLAACLQIRAICYASQHHTDGLIPPAVLPLLTLDLDSDSDGEIRHRPDWGLVMIGAGLWERDNLGYRIHDYLEWNLSKHDMEVMKKKLSMGGKKGMKSRWNKEKSDITQDITRANNSTITSLSTSTDTLSSLHPNPNPNPDGEKILKKRGENGREYRDEARQVLTFLNEKAGKRFREVDVTLGLIEARLRSGVDVQTCKSLIARKVRDWGTDPKMRAFLRPETLFGKTKFESYLAEVSP